MSEPVVIVGFGASTPIGRDAWSTAAAVRAGLNRFGCHPSLLDSVGEPICVSRADWLGLQLTIAERIEALVLPAIEEAIESVEPHAVRGLRMALAVGLPATKVATSEGLSAALLARIRTRFPHRFQAAAVFSQGHAAGLLAIEAARRKLASGGVDACIVAAADSYIEPDLIERLEASDQLHGAGAHNNAWGFIPGEAAGALLVMRRDTARQWDLAGVANVLRTTGFSIESSTRGGTMVCIGEGLTTAFRQALAGLADGERVTDVYCDMNGEPYRADEFGFACLRTRESFVAPSDFVAPADCWGDVGAAGGILHAILAVIAGRKGYARGRTALLWASSEAGERAGVLISTGTAS